MKQITQETITGFLRRDYEKAKVAGADLVAARITLEAKGGPCESCGRPWKKIEVNHQYADYLYYAPDCDCFPRCPSCGDSWHRIADPGTPAESIEHCPACGWSLVKKWSLLCNGCTKGFEFHGQWEDRPRLCLDCMNKGGQGSTTPVPYAEYEEGDLDNVD